MKMEPTVSSETSAIRTQTPGNYPKRNKLQTETSIFQIYVIRLALDCQVNTVDQYKNIKKKIFNCNLIN